MAKKTVKKATKKFAAKQSKQSPQNRRKFHTSKSKAAGKDKGDKGDAVAGASPCMH